jgi:hypothetical protein
MDRDTGSVETIDEITPEPGVKTGSSKAWVILVALAVIGLIIFGVIALAQADSGTATRVRDIFIIFMALESLVIGAALVILIVQLAALSNLIQNEIKPLLDNTNQTVNNLKGTTLFLSDQLVGPVIKMNEYLAGLKRLFDIFRPSK